MLAIFIISGALQSTGVADVVGRKVHSLLGGREVPLIITIMLVAGGLSAFMNNIAATAVLMPAVASIAHRAGLAPSRLFMPLAFGAILGGTTTMVGTPPNILVAELLDARGQAPFGLFDFTPVGLLLLGCGVLFMITIGRRLLPTVETTAPHGDDLAQVYQLHERLFSIQIPADSALGGQSIGSSDIGRTLGVQVLAILRNGRRIVAPPPDTTMEHGDVLLVEGRIDDLEELVRVRDVEIEKTRLSEIPRPARGVVGIRATIPKGSPFIGETLKSTRFRETHGMTVLAVERDKEVLQGHLGETELLESDVLFGVGTRTELRKLGESPDLEVSPIRLSTVSQLQDTLYIIRIRRGSALVGTRLRDGRIAKLAGVTVAGLIRDRETHFTIAGDEVIREDDRYLVNAEPSRIIDLLQLGDIELEANNDVEQSTFESDEVGVVEVSLAPRSSLIGQTLRKTKFRDTYGLQVLAVWRNGRPIRTGLPDISLRFGDALLLQGSWDRFKTLAGDSNFVVLSQNVQAPTRTRKAPVAIGALALMVTMVVTGFQPIHVAAFTAAALVILFGALKMEEAYRVIEWRAIFLVAAVLPVGIAMERTGAALMVADSVTSVAGPLGPYAVLGALVVLSSLLSQGLDGAPAVVLLTPVALTTAEQLGLSPYPIMMGVGLAASAAFMTPFSHKANLLVMGAGGYRAMDYVRVGTPLTIVLLILMVILVPVFFPF